MTCTKYCEVCSCTVEVQEETNQVHTCGLEELGDDFGYVNDCPFTAEFSILEEYCEEEVDDFVHQHELEDFVPDYDDQ